jgi:hypothetical protein
MELPSRYRSRAPSWPTPKSISSLNGWDTWKCQCCWSEATGSPWHRVTVSNIDCVIEATGLELEQWLIAMNIWRWRCLDRGIYFGIHCDTLHFPPWDVFLYFISLFVPVCMCVEYVCMGVCGCVYVCPFYLEVEIVKAKWGFEGVGRWAGLGWMIWNSQRTKESIRIFKNLAHYLHINNHFYESLQL